MEFDPETRSAANIIYNKDIEEAVNQLGLLPSSFDRREEPIEIKIVEGATTPWGIRTAVQKIGGKIPDVIYDYGEHGKEPLTLVFGKTAQEVARKIIEIAKIITKK